MIELRHPVGELIRLETRLTVPQVPPNVPSTVPVEGLRVFFEEFESLVRWKSYKFGVGADVPISPGIATVVTGNSDVDNGAAVVSLDDVVLPGEDWAIALRAVDANPGTPTDRKMTAGVAQFTGATSFPLGQRIVVVANIEPNFQVEIYDGTTLTTIDTGIPRTPEPRTFVVKREGTVFTVIPDGGIPLVSVTPPLPTIPLRGIVSVTDPTGAGATWKIEYLTIAAGPSGPAAIRIRRASDGKWFNGTVAVPLDPFQTAVFDNFMTALDAVNLPGVFKFDFPQNRDTQGIADYHVRMKNFDSEKNLILRTGPALSALGPGKCALFGTIRDPQGSPHQNVAIKVTIVPVVLIPVATGISLIEVDATTNENGEFSLSLGQGLRVRLEIPAIGYDRRVLIPVAAAVDFTTL